MRVSYTVTLDPARHELGVEIAIDDAPDAELILATPIWTPGDYDFESYGRDVFAVAATTPSGAAVTVRRRGWSAYAIAAAGASLRVSYRAAASSIEFSEECGVLGDSNGVLLGTRYLQVLAHEGPVEVRYVIPRGWAIHHPSGATALGDNRWAYDSYARLLDTPVAFGAFDLITRDVGGTPFHHLFLNRAVGFEGGVQRLVDDLTKVAAGFGQMFGGFPFADYTFVMSFNPNDDWGLEHLSSTMVGLDPSTFYDTDQYKVSVRVCAHELFHAWNVRRLRPAPLGHLDFQQGAFSEGLWVAEGFTRYYEFLACARAGLYTADQFLSAVTNYYTHLEALPAYQRVSPADSSAASYLNHDKYPGRANSAIDYYDAGMVIAFELDATLRSAAPSSSLDQVFAAFYRAYAERGAGYTVEDICAAFEAAAPGLGDRLRAMATQPARLDLPGQLQALGFEVTQGPTPCLGVILQNDTGPMVYSVLDTSAAGRSGLAAEDIIVSVNGRPFSPELLTWAAAHEPQVTLDVLRGNEPLTYVIAPGRRTTVTRLAWTGTPDQAQRISTWLQTPFAPAPGQDIPLDFYENFHGIETVI
jgi:predicted metalloprotease with PDZ domain